MEVDKYFTQEECDDLIVACDAWVSMDFGDSIMEGLLTALAPKEAQQGLEEKNKEREINRKATMQIRKEKAILLKAKLLQLRDKCKASAFLQT